MPRKDSASGGVAEPQALIRVARSSDTAVLGKYGAALVALHNTLDPQRFFPTTDRTEVSYASWLGRQLEREDVVLLVAEVDLSVIGYVYGVLEGPDYMALRGPAGVIHDLFVDPHHRRSGVGSRLLQAAISNFEERGAPRVVLSTAARNEVAQRLFASLRFRPTMVEMTRDL
ncbi:GNAT family N-acetyltransferase [Neorhizobium sp. P12A]|uniref:GNAT family N-acetyltransferase n=1 Tax=Neorhizobium sp. P12A TaxID=2268027 RepID=UPI0011EDE576|nr:GNAT family N-acetyltransferase [Neorhizobium sp. P12A]KAA0694534.1 GNAT family N-acetyltransferase [Neorhizobium sp. P12A]